MAKASLRNPLVFLTFSPRQAMEMHAKCVDEKSPMSGVNIFAFAILMSIAVNQACKRFKRKTRFSLILPRETDIRDPDTPPA